MKAGVVALLFLLISSFPIVPAVAQYDDDIVVAQEWEGIYELLLRFELNPSEMKAAFLQKNAKKLKGDTILIAGTTYLLPEAPKEITIKSVSAKESTYPIFGKKYAKVPVIDQQLKGAIYYLVSGHGGPDPGAMGTYGGHTLTEDEYAYDVTLRLARNLISHGAKVYLIIQDKNDGIRDQSILPMDKQEVTYKDEKLPLNQKARLKQRADEVNELYAANKGAYQRLIVIHIDSRSKGQNIDVFFYHHHNSQRGKHLASEIHKVFKSKYERHQPGRNYYGSVSSRSSLYMVKNTHPPMVYIELGNIKNYRDQLRFVRSDNRQALANWIELGVINDFEKSSR